MPTEKLYFEDSYLKEFTAEILNVTPHGDQYAVILDRTAFYPEVGGQPADTGFINDIPVVDVIEARDEILHILPTSIDTGKARCRIDWEKRFDHMQQHTGQHILSACFYKLCGGETNSFHIGKDSATIEIMLPSLDEEAIIKVEEAANQILYKNLPVSASIIDGETLKTLPLRKQPKVSENIRVVHILDTDYSPCGGTHVSRTGEVGIIKIKRFEKTKDSCRFEFLCGHRALLDYRMKNNTIISLGAKLSTRDYEVEGAIDKTLSDYRELQKQLGAARQTLLKQEAEKILQENHGAGIHIINHVFDGRDINDIRVIAQNIIETPSKVVLFVCKNETAQALFSRSDDVAADMGALLKKLIPMLCGKGGGSAKAAQGGGSHLDAVDEFLREASEGVKKQLGL